MIDIRRYISLLIYYSIGIRLPNKLGGIGFRRILIKNILKECGKGVRISEGVYFGMGKNLILKDNARIGPGCKIYGNGNVIIESKNIMGPEVMIITGDHKISIDHDDKLINNKITGNILIGEETFIGARVTILQGVTIGKRSVVAACSLVNKSTKEKTLVGGIPATNIKSISDISNT